MSRSSGFKTTDLTLATFLRLRGCSAEVVKDGERAGGRPVGAWLFGDTTEVRELVRIFERGEARVEPKEFHDAINRYREELFRVLGIGKDKKGKEL
jgi:hypothetical protein